MASRIHIPPIATSIHAEHPNAVDQCGLDTASNPAVLWQKLARTPASTAYINACRAWLRKRRALRRAITCSMVM